MASKQAARYNSPPMPDLDVKLKSNGAYWQAWWFDAAGEVKAKSIGSKSKFSQRQARVKCRQLAMEMARGLATGKAMPLSQWIERYKLQRTDQADSTRELNDYAGRYLLAYFDNDPPIDRINRAEAADWRHALATGELSLDNKQHCKAPSEQTVCKHVRIVKRMFKEAADQDLIAFNPFDRLRGTPPPPVRDWREITADNMKAVLEACPNNGWRALFSLCRWVGLRRQEAIDLRWQDVRFDTNRLIVNATIDVETTKRALRTPPIEAARCPTGFLAYLRQLFDEAPTGAVRPCEDVDRGNVDTKARSILKASGVGVYAKPFHTLRKCRVSEVAQQYPQGVVTDWFGHDAEVSQTYYQRVPEELYAMPGEVGVVAQNVPSRVKTR